MTETPQDKRFKITVLVLVFACFLFIPAAFYYGIAGVLSQWSNEGVWWPPGQF